MTSIYMEYISNTHDICKNIESHIHRLSFSRLETLYWITSHIIKKTLEITNLAREKCSF